MNRKEAEDYIYKSYMRAEKFQKYGDRDAKKRHPELSKKILEGLSSYPNICITGSKGKGSVANMLSQILMTKFKVGLFTSPHIYRINERFKINGKDISEEDFVKNMETVKKLFDPIIENLPDDIPLSPMALEAALALVYFKNQKTDINVLELGKGAKYDDVNNPIHDYAIINKIFLEHTRELGSSLEEIAHDKKEIIKKGQKCIYSASQALEVLKILKDKAKEVGVQLKIYGEDFWADSIKYSLDGMTFDGFIGEKVFRDIKIPLIGKHQVENALLALAAAYDIFGDFDLDLVKKNLRNLSYPARFEIISKDPLIILDACINGKSCPELKKSLKELGIKKITSIVGVPDDKDFLGVCNQMKDLSQEIILTKTSNAHYVFTSKQREILRENNIFVRESRDIKEALEMSGDSYPILILGTTSLISESKIYFREKEGR
ncbi:bifunctional folylpolyglutamate synthase/dihydrofolate synthase [Peptoniphilus raoultii]|uniref:bifunctional folylpolyglutamate synthase/dihydrofolate synthase n=1 Tax=Peptoniphilus raoultii TaxID=1776387 RepID=UPI0008DA1A70|nr:Mur ligase family protein [Peptoniphilus raoultii]